MGFVMDGLDSEAYDRKYNDRDLVRRILTYFRPHRRTMAIVAGAIGLSSLVGTGVPLLISRGIDAIAPTDGSTPQHDLPYRAVRDGDGAIPDPLGL